MGRPGFQFLFQANQRFPCRPPKAGGQSLLIGSLSLREKWGQTLAFHILLTTGIWGNSEGYCYLIVFGEKMPNFPTTWRGTKACSCVGAGVKPQGATKLWGRLCMLAFPCPIFKSPWKKPCHVVGHCMDLKASTDPGTTSTQQERRKAMP